MSLKILLMVTELGEGGKDREWDRDRERDRDRGRDRYWDKDCERSSFPHYDRSRSRNGGQSHMKRGAPSQVRVRSGTISDKVSENKSSKEE